MDQPKSTLRTGRGPPFDRSFDRPCNDLVNVAANKEGLHRTTGR